MRSLKIGLVLALGMALSIGFAQGNAKMGKEDHGKGTEQSKMARHHGKMTVKATGHTQAMMARHHGKMAPKHHTSKRHKGKMMVKKGHRMEMKGHKMMAKGHEMMKGHDSGNGKKGGK